MGGPLPVPTDPVELAAWVERELVVGGVARLVPELLDAVAVQHDRRSGRRPIPPVTTTEAEYRKNRGTYLDLAVTSLALVVELDRVASALAPEWAAAAPGPVAGASTAPESAPAAVPTCPEVCTCDPARCDDQADGDACYQAGCALCMNGCRYVECPHLPLLQTAGTDAYWQAHRPAGAAAASPAAAPAPEPKCCTGEPGCNCCGPVPE